MATMTRQDAVAPDERGIVAGGETRALRVAVLGNPNTGKTTLFNRLCGVRHKTSNFPGTTQEARVGVLVAHASDGRGTTEAVGEADRVGAGGIELVDMPGIYSLELEQPEAEVCRSVLAGTLALRGEVARPPDAVCVVMDATNLSRNLLLAGEALRRRLPTLVVVNLIDAARSQGLAIDVSRLSAHVGCEVVLASARTGEGCEGIGAALAGARIPNCTPPGTQEGLEAWAEAGFAASVSGGDSSAARAARARTDRLDHVLAHPVLGLVGFAAVMAVVFWTIFRLADYPMRWIEGIFVRAGSLLEAWMPAGVLRDFLSQGVVGGVSATLVFLPQICLLFFLIALLEDTGYLARAAFVMDRVLRPFGLPGHSFVPLLSSHACAIPGIMACRGIPDRRQRLATILVAPYMTCSARLPVYALVTGILFPGRPALAALAFVGCYALGIAAALFTARLVRSTVLKGGSRGLILELPPYRRPSVRTALLTTYDRALVFVKNAGTNILAISVLLWWLGAYPRSPEPAEAARLRAQAAEVASGRAERVGADVAEATGVGPVLAGASEEDRARVAEHLTREADRAWARNAKPNSFVGRIGRTVQPVFEPLGYDWRLTVGVLTSFAAREVFASTMGIVVAGTEDVEDKGVRGAIATASRDDGKPLFSRATSWSVLVFFVLAMQCLPTLVLTAKESGHPKWALLQFGWMSVVAYSAACVVYQAARALGAG